MSQPGRSWRGSRLPSAPWWIALILGAAGCSKSEPEGTAPRKPQGSERGLLESTLGEPTAFAADGFGGELYVAAIVHDGREDRVVLFEGSHEIEVSEAPGRSLTPSVLATGDRRAIVVWASHRDGSYDLVMRTVEGGRSGEIVRLTRDPGAEAWPAMARDESSGEVFIAWQAQREGRCEIRLAELTDAGLESERLVSLQGEDSFRPSIDVDASGRPAVAFDAFRLASHEKGEFDVLLYRTFEGQGERVIDVSRRPGYDAQASVACDGEGGAWIAWHADEGDWGRTRGLAHARHVRLAYQKGEHLRDAPIPPSQAFPRDIAELASNPKIAFDAEGGLRMVFSAMLLGQYQQKKIFPGLTEFKAAVWELFVTRLDGSGWADVERIETSSGGAALRGLLAISEGVSRVVWQTDKRMENLRSGIDQNRRRPGSARSELRSATLSEQVRSLPALPASALREPVRVVAPSPVQSEPRSIESRGRAYRLLFADLHRHTDISRCASRTDGTLEEAYRYALGPGRLDVLCTTDHVTDTRDVIWWEIQKLADFYDAKGSFVGLYGYERAEGAIGGHKNLFFLERGGPQILRFAAKTPRDLWKLLGQVGSDVFAIPHMSASLDHPTDWSFHDPRFEPAVEIYQGVRGSYESRDGPRRAEDAEAEGGFVRDALLLGHRLGFVAASDHNSTAESYTGLFVTEVSRSGVFEAVKARRSFAATDRIFLDFRADGHLAGEIFTPEGPPELTVEFEGTAKVVRIEILADGDVIQRSEPGTRSGEARFVDAEWTKRRFYYARLIQEDEGVAWASPIWVR